MGGRPRDPRQANASTPLESKNRIVAFHCQSNRPCFLTMMWR